MPAGRLTACTLETVEACLHYIDNHKDFDDVVPSIAGLSIATDIPRRTLYDWADYEAKNDEDDDPRLQIPHILAKIKIKQEKMLLSGGLSNEMNSNIVKLMLGKHDYKDRSETDLTADVNLTAEEWLERMAEDDAG